MSRFVMWFAAAAASLIPLSAYADGGSIDTEGGWTGWIIFGVVVIIALVAFVVVGALKTPDKK